MQFLARCLPSSASFTAPPATLPPANPPLHWKTLLDAARWHGVLPMLAAQLLAEGSSAAVPSLILTEVRAHRERQLFRSLAQTATLANLQRAFDHRGLTVISWKGPSLAALLYGAPTLREAADLDFLILGKDLPAILAITRQLGFELLGKSASESRDLYIFSLQREFTFGREHDQLALEFHLQVLPSRYSRWQTSHHDIPRASTVCSLAGVDLRMQCPEDLLVSLCAHATKHYWDRMKWTCDIARFLSVYGPALAWTPFLRSLRTSRKDSVVLLGLALAADLFNLTLSPEVTAALATRTRIRPLARRLAAHMLSGRTGSVGLPERKAILALLCPRIRDRLAYTLRPVFELNYADLRIPPGQPLFFLNYGVRLLRLLRKYTPGILLRKIARALRSVH